MSIIPFIIFLAMVEIDRLIYYKKLYILLFFIHILYLVFLSAGISDNSKFFIIIYGSRGLYICFCLSSFFNQFLVMLIIPSKICVREFDNRLIIWDIFRTLIFSFIDGIILFQNIFLNDYSWTLSFNFFLSLVWPLRFCLMLISIAFHKFD